MNKVLPNELPGRWRRMVLDEGFTPHHRDMTDCADELQASIAGLWTRITEEPGTWPSLLKTVMVVDTERDTYTRTFLSTLQVRIKIGCHWRPLMPGIDYPEQTP